MGRHARVAGVYTLATLLTCVLLALLHEGSPLTLPDPWLDLSPGESHAYSALLGLGLGLAVALVTRPMVYHLKWARELHSSLRPFARGLSASAVLALALLSSVCEELLFRALLMPWLGLVPQAILFGLVHQLPGKSRWVWVTWASFMGLVLGTIFQLTGALIGSIVAHAIINGFNLAFLKQHDTKDRPKLGGLLGQM